MAIRKNVYLRYFYGTTKFLTVNKLMHQCCGYCGLLLGIVLKYNYVKWPMTLWIYRAKHYSMTFWASIIQQYLRSFGFASWWIVFRGEILVISWQWACLWDAASGPWPMTATWLLHFQFERHWTGPQLTRHRIFLKAKTLSSSSHPDKKIWTCQKLDWTDAEGLSGVSSETRRFDAANGNLSLHCFNDKWRNCSHKKGSSPTKVKLQRVKKSLKVVIWFNILVALSLSCRETIQYQ